MIINVSEVHYGGQFVHEAIKAGWLVVSPHVTSVYPWGTYTIKEATNLDVGAIEALNNVIASNIVIYDGSITLCDLEELNKLLSKAVIVVS